MELRVVRTLDHFDEIQAQWDGLLTRIDPVPLPLTHGWLRSWLDAFSFDSEMEFRCVFRGEDLVGIAPFVRSRSLYRGIPVTVLRLAANGHTPYSSIVVDTSVPGEIRKEVLTALTRVGPEEVGVFFKIHENSELHHFLMNPASGAAKRVGQKPSLSTPVIQIDQTWDEFYGSRPRKLKKSLNNKRNKFDRSGRFSISEEKIISAEQSIVDELIRISANSWKSRIGNDLGSNSRSRRFFLNLIASFGQLGTLSAWIIRSKDKPVAYELHLSCDGVVYPIRADYDEGFKAYSPGSILEYTALKSLFESGTCRQYYTCADDYWYLSNWANGYQSLCTVELFGSHWTMRALYEFEYRLIPLVKRMIGRKDRTVRPLD